VPVDLRALAAEVLGEANPSLDWSVEGTATTVRADRAQLARLLRNLVQNAEKYAPPGSSARIELFEDGLEVRDTGPGVEPDELSHLFEPFYRGHRHPRATGWGLGLMIAKQIAEMHEGSLEARNAEPHGLALRLRIPPAA